MPGHGQICGQEGISSIREVFDDIAGQAEKMYKAGVLAEEAQHRYFVPDKFKNFPIFAWASPSARHSPNSTPSGKE